MAKRRRGGGHRLPRPSPAPSNAAEFTPALEASFIRNLDSAFSRRDSDVSSICSSRRASAAGAGAGAGPNFSDRSTQAAALRVVNGFLAPAVALKGPLPVARDINEALRLLVDRLDLPRNDATFEDDLIQDLRMLGCPYKVTRSALKAPGTPHAWPAVLAILHWLTLFCHAHGDDLDAPAGPSNDHDLLLYTTQGYSHFLMGDDDTVAAVDEDYASKARMTGESSIATVGALEKEAEELETEVNKLVSGPSRQQALEAEKANFHADLQKFEAVLDAWKTRVKEREQVLGDLEKELEAKVSDTQCAAAEIQDLLKQVDAQPMNVRDMDRIRREMQAIEDEVANTEKGKAALEDKVWEVEAKLVNKLEELERLAEKCNQVLKRLKPNVAFQYMIDSEGSSPAEMLGSDYKTVLKPALGAHAEENKRTCLSNLENLNDLQKQLQGNIKVLEEERNNISSLQAKNDKMVARLNSLDHEIINDDSRFASEAGQMKDELEKKKKSLISLEMQADDFLKMSEKRLQDATHHAEQETQVAAKDLLELLDDLAEDKEVMEETIAQRWKDLYETADYIAGLFAGTSAGTS